MPAPPVVDARGLTKVYGSRRVVDDLTFAVASGETLGLLGPNGAGKTTTIKMVTCFAPPTGGTPEVLGLPRAPATHPAIKAAPGLMQQEDGPAPDHSSATAL